MCGIIGRVGDGDALPELLDGLQNLEYRGYDSAGVAIRGNGHVAVEKRQGEISDLRDTLEDAAISGETGIGHTRWSTHGEPSDANAHPHTDCTGRVAVVHNGIIENYGALRDELRAAGHEFESETDSEVVPHLMESNLADGMTPREAFAATTDRLEGSYALAVIVEEDDVIYATRQDSPLVIGVDGTARYLASDVPAFLHYTNEVIYIEDGDVVELNEGEHRVWTADGNRVDRSIDTVEWDAEETAKGQYDHFMEKEIFVQPDALTDTLTGRFDTETGDITFEALEDGQYADVEHVRFIACGTSYHAAMFGATLLTHANIDASACRASEFTPRGVSPEDSLVVAVTQSGETADTLNAMRAAAAEGIETLAITNVVGSSAAREADETIYIRAGPEIGVAATKTFSSQAAHPLRGAAGRGLPARGVRLRTRPAPRGTRVTPRRPGDGPLPEQGPGARLAVRGRRLVLLHRLRARERCRPRGRTQVQGDHVRARRGVRRRRTQTRPARPRHPRDPRLRDPHR